MLIPLVAFFIALIGLLGIKQEPDNRSFPTERYENYQEMVTERLAAENAKIDFKCHTCKMGLTRSQTIIIRATPYCSEHRPSHYIKNI